MKVHAEIKEVRANLSKAKGARRKQKEAEKQRMTVDLAKKEINAPVMKGPPPQKTLYPIVEERFGPPPEPINQFHAQLDPKVSIQIIIDTIEALNCPECTGGFAPEVAKKGTEEVGELMPPGTNGKQERQVLHQFDLTVCGRTRPGGLMEDVNEYIAKAFWTDYCKKIEPSNTEASNHVQILRNFLAWFDQRKSGGQLRDLRLVKYSAARVTVDRAMGVDDDE